MAQGRWFAV